MNPLYLLLIATITTNTFNSHFPLSYNNKKDKPKLNVYTTDEVSALLLQEFKLIKEIRETSEADKRVNLIENLRRLQRKSSGKPL